MPAGVTASLREAVEARGGRRGLGRAVAGKGSGADRVFSSAQSIPISQCGCVTHRFGRNAPLATLVGLAMLYGRFLQALRTKA